MKWVLPSGRAVWKNDAKYRINWDKKSRSKFQFNVKQFFKEVAGNQIWFEEYNLPGTRLRVDLLNATKKIAIECHGVGHDKFNTHFHNNSRINYFKSIQRDVKKALYLEKNEYQLIEIFPEDLPLTKDWFISTYNVYF